MSRWNAPGPAARAGNQTVVLIAARIRAPMTSPRCWKARAVVQIRPAVRDRRASERRLPAGFKAGEYAIPSSASMAADRRHPDRRQIHPAQAHRRRGPDQRDDLRSWSKPIRSWSAMPGRCPPKARLLPETYLFTRGDTRRAICWPRWHKAQKRSAWRQPGPVARQDLPFKTPARGDHPGLHRGKGNRAAGRAPPCRRGFHQPAAKGMKLQIRSDHHLWPDPGLSAWGAASGRASWKRPRPTTPM